MSWKILEGVAVLLYGSLALIMLLVLAIWRDSVAGAALVICAAGLSYVYQAVVYQTDANGWLMHTLQAVIVSLATLSLLLSIGA